VTFGNPAQAATSASFAMPGTYTLMLAVGDNVHAVARDAVVVHVALPVVTMRVGDDATVMFHSAAGQTYRVERADAPGGPWTLLADNLAGTGAGMSVSDPGVFQTHPSAAYRVRYTPE